MAVTRAPKRPVPALADERAALEVIGRGGSVKADQAASPLETDPVKSVQLRLYQSTLDEIDALRGRQAGARRPVSRHAWMVAAIEEKLERERRKSR